MQREARPFHQTVHISQRVIFSRFLDIEGLNARDPYGSSKFLVNLLSTKMRCDGKMSFICDPGTFSSNITLSMVPAFFKIFLLIFFFIVQPFQPKLTRSPKNAMQSILYAFNQGQFYKNVQYKSAKGVLLKLNIIDQKSSSRVWFMSSRLI